MVDVVLAGRPARARRRPSSLLFGLLAAVLGSLFPIGAAMSTGNEVLLEWHGGNGWITFTIDNKYLARYHFHPTGFGAQGRREERNELQLKPEEVERLQRELFTHKVCALKSQRPHPVPEEREATLRLSFPPSAGNPALRCEITMWNNEWSDFPNARACERAIDTLLGKTRTAPAQK